MKYVIPKEVFKEVIKQALTNSDPIKGAAQLSVLQKVIDDPRVETSNDF